MKCLQPLLWVAISATSLAAPTKLEIPDDHWVEIYFESIDEVAALVGVPPLQKKTLPEGSIELRFWQGFGLSSLEGTQITRTGDNWRGLRFTPNWSEDLTYQTFAVEPLQGWDSFWKKLEGFNIGSLPDASTLKSERIVLDGVSYVVEISNGENYRTYMYSNPRHESWSEARQIEQIADAMREDLKFSGQGESHRWSIFLYSAGFLTVAGVATLIRANRKKANRVPGSD